VKEADSSETLLSARLNGVTSKKTAYLKNITSVAYPFVLTSKKVEREK
jgi:hypothetical protein